MNKKILMVGVLDVPSSTNVFMKKGFEQLGFYVDDYNYRTLANHLSSLEGMWDDFRRFLIGRDYHLIVFCKVNGMHPILLNEAKEIAPTWYWFMDPMDTARKMHASTYAQNATFCSATASDVKERFALVNKNANHIFEGYDQRTYYYEDLPKIHDLLFIGNHTFLRQMQINQIKAHGFNVSIFGGGWPDWMNASGPVHGEDERTEINQAKWVLNLTQDDVIFSDRVIKALGCGANVISTKCKDLRMFNGYVRTYENMTEFKNIIYDKKPNTVYSSHVAEMMAEDFCWREVCARILMTVDKWKNEENRKKQETVEDIRRKYGHS
jgi:hypothetical protein